MLAEGVTPQAGVQVTGLITVHLDPVHLTPKGEFKLGDLRRCYECPPCILMTNRSPNSISRLKQGSARPGLRPKLVGLRPAYPIITDTG